MEDEYQPTGDDADVLDVIRDEQRTNPYLIRQRTGLGKGEVNTILGRLTDYGYVRKKTRGLYDYAGGAHDDRKHAECHEAVLSARSEIEAVLEEMDRGNAQSARKRVEMALETLNEVDV